MEKPYYANSSITDRRKDITNYRRATLNKTGRKAYGIQRDITKISSLGNIHVNRKFAERNTRIMKKYTV